jgi:single-strand DNA-binding protein
VGESGIHKYFNLNFSIMSTLRNKVQLIGNVGNAPEIKNLESGKKVASFSIATNEFYKNSNGEKVQNTQWHSIVAWGKTAEIVENYVGKGKEIAIEGKLTSRSYETKDGEKRYVTEILASEILLLGGNASNGDN